MTNTIDPRDTDDAVLEELFRGARPRPRPPREVEETVRANLHEEWASLVARRRYRRTATWAMAAGLALAAALGLFQLAVTPTVGVRDVDVATVERRVGDELLWSPGGSAFLEPLAPGQVLTVGQRIATGDGSRLALAHRQGGSLRLDEHSTVTFVATDRIELTSGRLYYDSGAAAGPALSVLTAYAEVAHRGTQFMVDVSNDTLEVSVREGRVLVENYRGSERVDAGNRLRVGMNGRGNLQPYSGHGDAWAWVADVSPPVQQDQWLVHEFLGWVGRETGRKIVYASPEVEREARQNRIVGNVELPPMQALRTLLPATGLRFRIDGDSIVIEPPTGD